MKQLAGKLQMLCLPLVARDSVNCSFRCLTILSMFPITFIVLRAPVHVCGEGKVEVVAAHYSISQSLGVKMPASNTYIGDQGLVDRAPEEELWQKNPALNMSNPPHFKIFGEYSSMLLAELVFESHI